MLLIGSGDEFCGLLPALFQAVAYHWPAVGPSAFLAFVYWKLLASPLFSSVLSGTPSWKLCVSFQFLVYCSVFFYGEGVSLPRGLCCFYLGVLGEYHVMLGLQLTCLVCRMSPKKVWSWCLAAWEPSCFLIVTWHGEAFHRLGVQDVEIFILLAALFLQVWLQHLSEVLESQSSCCLLLYPSCHLGSPPKWTF
jgi:hypothetical protein